MLTSRKTRPERGRRQVHGHRGDPPQRGQEEAACVVVESDLGEYIIQLENELPSHIVALVIHKRLEDVADIFQRELDLPPTLDPEIMCSAARQQLRKEFLGADMGISGCNFAIAETGTVCIVTNEGNGRMTSSMPRVYVAVMGIEKLVPTVEDDALLSVPGPLPQRHRPAVQRLPLHDQRPPPPR
ncbi:MAG: LUD domain-containing protein [Caldilineaceae bacterium]